MISIVLKKKIYKTINIINEKKLKKKRIVDKTTI